MARVQMAGAEGEPAVFAEINMIPFIDVALVLLIIFMVISPMLVQAGLKVDLPAATTAAPTEDKSVQVGMGADGQVFFDGKPVALEALFPLTQAKLASQPGALFVIKADAKSRYDKVIRLADALRQGGATRLAFGTSPLPPKAEEAVPTP